MIYVAYVYIYIYIVYIWYTSYDMLLLLPLAVHDRLLKGAYLSSFHGICQLVHMCNNGLKVIVMMPICHYDWKLRLHMTCSAKSMLDIVQW